MPNRCKQLKMRLFRYRKGNIEYLTSELLKNEFYLWNLNQQNDPFEGRLLFLNNLSEKAVLQGLKNTRSAIQRGTIKWKDWLITKEEKENFLKIKNSSDKELELLAKKSIHRGDYNENGIALIKERYRRMTDKVVMSCFSTKQNSPIMFAHYADNHKGVCLEYEVDSKDFFKVNYTEDYPKLELFNPMPDSVIKYRLLTKHKDWEYESEYRLIQYNREPGTYSHQRIKLKAIYLGLNCEEKTKKEIKTIIANKKDELEIYSLSLPDDDYELQYTPY